MMKMGLRTTKLILTEKLLLITEYLFGFGYQLPATQFVAFAPCDRAA